jgi:hypothetical protein
MPKRSRKPGQGPEDLNSMAKRILDAATEDEPVAPQGEPVAEPEKDPAAVALGRKGGLKGGRARADAMTAKQRSAAAKKAAKARWGR